MFIFYHDNERLLSFTETPTREQAIAEANQFAADNRRVVKEIVETGQEYHLGQFIYRNGALIAFMEGIDGA